MEIGDPENEQAWLLLEESQQSSREARPTMYKARTKEEIIMVVE